MDHGRSPYRPWRFLAPGWVWAVSLIPVLLIEVTSLRWALHPPQEYVYTGYLQNDQHAYTALIRELYENGNGIVSGNPHNVNRTRQHYFFSLPLNLLSIVERISGLPFWLLWDCFRVFWGALMGVTLYRLVRTVLSPDGPVNLAYLAGLFGGGMAWLFSLALYTVGAEPGLIPALDQVEADYQFWLLSVFRQALYPLELYYHTLAFAALGYAISGRTRPLYVLFPIIILSHPFTMIEVTAVITVFAAVEFVLKRERLLIGPALCALGCAAAYGLFSVFVVRESPEGASIIGQSRRYFLHTLPLWKLIPAYGFLLLAAVVGLVLAEPRRRLLQARSGRFALSWVAVVFLLSRTPAWFQPLHYTRGYFLLGLVLLVGIAFAPEIAAFTRQIRWGRPLCAAAVAILALDSLLFTIRLTTVPPQQEVLLLPTDMAQVIDRLNQYPGEQIVLTAHQRLEYLIPSMTPHRTLIGQDMYTPWYLPKVAEIRKWLAGENPELPARLRVRLVALPQDVVSMGRFNPDADPRYTLVLRNRTWSLWEFKR